MSKATYDQKELLRRVDSNDEEINNMTNITNMQYKTIPTVITLCGDIGKYPNAFTNLDTWLTLNSAIVMLPNTIPGDATPETVRLIDMAHSEKIIKSAMVIVVVGKDREIEHFALMQLMAAVSQGTPVYTDKRVKGVIDSPEVYFGNPNNLIGARPLYQLRTNDILLLIGGKNRQGVPAGASTGSTTGLSKSAEK